MPTSTQSRVPASPSMAKQQPEIDNHFCPGRQDQGSLFTVIFSVVLAGLGLAGWALTHTIGRF